MSPGDSKARIQQEAAEVLSRDGYNGMGLKALSEATGLPIGSIYHHFPGGKDEIAVTAIVETAEAIAQLLEALLADGVTEDAIGRMFGFMADRLEATDFVAGCVVGTPALDDPTPAPEVLGACASGFDRLSEPIVAAFVREGRSAEDARAMATTLLAAYEGATVLARAQRSRAPLDDAAEAMVRLVALTR
jgi:AcrR family transcriptional regulator